MASSVACASKIVPMVLQDTACPINSIKSEFGTNYEVSSGYRGLSNGGTGICMSWPAHI